MPISRIKTDGIQDDAITSAKIGDTNIQSADIAAGAVTSAKLDTNIDIAGTLDVTSTTTLDSTLAVAGHSSIGNAGTVDGTRALTVVGATDGTGSSIIVGYNSSLSSKFSVRDDGYTTIGAGMNVQGNITFASGAGIDFSGNANASGMTSELLDDYEEGTWTPIINDASYGDITTTTNHATYTKIGNLVYLDFYLTRNDSASATSTMYITNLPFGTLPVSARLCGHAWWDNASSDWRTFIYLGASSTSAYVLVPGNSSTYLTTNLFENGRYVYGSMCYRAS